jgi:UDP-N-acetylglucosamine:LPS N-acetylglucosamine transferase
MKKIAYLLHDWDGRLGYFDNTMVKILSAAQCSVYVVTPNLKHVVLTEKSVTYVKTDYAIKATNNLYFSRNLNKTLEKIKPDIIFTLDGMLDALTVNRYVKKTKAKWYVKCHCDSSNTAIGKWSYIFHKTVMRAVYGVSDSGIHKYLYITPQTKKFMRTMYRVKSKKLRFFPIISSINKNIRLCSNARVEADLPKKSLKVFTGGRIDALKKTELLVEAARCLVGVVELIIVGKIDGSDKKFASNIKSLIDRSDNIKFYPWADQDALAKAISLCDVGVFPAGQSTLWQDCLALNVPIIVGSGTDVADQDPRYLTRNGSGIVIDRHLMSKDTLITELMRLYSDKNLLKNMRERCEKNNYKFFSEYQLIRRIL